MNPRKEFASAIVLSLLIGAQAYAIEPSPQPQIPLQPIAEQVRQLEALLTYFGQPFSEIEEKGINRAIANPDSNKSVEQIEAILATHVLAEITINSASDIGVTRGEVKADLVQHGMRCFLVKIVNRSGIKSRLEVDSPNGGPVYKSVNADAPRPPAPSLSPEDIYRRWIEASFLHGETTEPELPNDLDIEARIQQRETAAYTMVSQLPDGLGIQDNLQLLGSSLEYRIILIYSRDAGQRSATLDFKVGQVTQNSGKITILFNIAPSRKIKLHVLDDNGQPTTASFIFRDSLGRLYPNPLKRSAPDLYFEPQVYRADGEVISLPLGSFTATFTGGPEYITKTQKFVVNRLGPDQLTFNLKRWIDPAAYGWYSGDDHIHAAGCAHYSDPTLGVSPEDMERQVLGEHLNVASILDWGPDYYYQLHFFRGQQDSKVSKPGAVLHYDLEVSGFPSSHSGHLILLNLANQNYPAARQIEDWPSWELPIIHWARSQGATVGFAHSGGGLALGSTNLPNYNIPAFNAPGALEYLVDATYPDTIEFLEVGNGPFSYDLNMWYQALNVGLRTRIAGGTDFPCIYDTRVGMVRTYATVGGAIPAYSKWMTAIRDGESYVSDGGSHLMNFTVDGTEVGTRRSEVVLRGHAMVQIKVDAAAYLDPIPDKALAGAPFDWEPYWSIERARIGDTRRVPVDVIVNGEVVARQEINADGSVQKLTFSVPIRQSSWIALRIIPSSHTNPIFVLLDGRPIRASHRSAKWCLAAVDQSWSQQASQISAHELPEAAKAYEHARQVYRTLINESNNSLFSSAQ